MTSTDYKGDELESAWAKALAPHCDVRRSSEHEDRMGIDLILGTKGFAPAVQVKGSPALAIQHMEAGAGLGRYIPVLVGEPPLDLDPDEIRDALSEEGVYVADSINRRTAAELREVARASAELGGGIWFPHWLKQETQNV